MGTSAGFLVYEDIPSLGIFAGMRKDWKTILAYVAIITLLLAVPLDSAEAEAAISKALSLLQEYVREYFLGGLLPAFFIAATLGVFVRKETLLNLLGPTSNRLVAYPVASVSGAVLAVCSCTILPLFTGIYKRGAGIGPAVAFLFTGPAINIAAIFLTGTVLGWDFSIGRLLAAISISIVAGLVMTFVFRGHDASNGNRERIVGTKLEHSYSTKLISAFMFFQVLVLVSAGLIQDSALWRAIMLGSLAAILYITTRLIRKSDTIRWLDETWSLVKEILPFLLIGIAAAGLIETLIPPDVVLTYTGDSSLRSNAIVSAFGALMYFCTLTEVPVVQTLMHMGMSDGAAFSLLLTSNSLSLPGMFVLFRVMGWRQAGVYILTVYALSVGAGWIFGNVL